MFAVGALEAGDRAQVPRVLLVQRRQALALKPGGRGLQTGGAGTVPVDYGAGQRGPLLPPRVGGVPPRSIVAALLLVAVVVELALRQRRRPLTFAWKQTGRR